MITHRTGLLLTHLWVFCQIAIPRAAPPGPEAAPASPSLQFGRDIAPILAAKCLNCHGPDKPKGGYQLHTFEKLKQSGDSDLPPVVPGASEQSELYHRLVTENEDDRMPQKDDALAPDQIGLIKRWIDQGALFDGPDEQLPLALLVPAGPHPAPPASYLRPVPILALAFRPGGQELAAGGYHEITIWNPEKGQLLRRITNVTQRLQSLAYHPSQNLLAAAGGIPAQRGEVALYDPESGARVRTLGSAPDFFLAVDISPDGALLAAGGADHSIHIFEVATGNTQRLIQQHADWVTGLRFHPKGNLLASASRDRSARLYDVQTGELMQTYYEHEAAVHDVAFSANGETAASTGRDKEIHFWKSADRKKAGEISGLAAENLRLLAAGSRLFAAASDRRIREYDFSDRKLARTFEGHADWVYAMAAHEKSDRLATGSYDGEVRVWNLKDGSLVSSFTAAPGYLVKGATPPSSPSSSR